MAVLSAVRAYNPNLARPEIRFIDSELPHIVNLAAEAAVDAEAQIYGRGTTLVRPVTVHLTNPQRGIRRAEGTTMLVPVEKPSLVEILTGLIDWQKFDGRSEKWKHISCPPVIAETMLARRGDWPFPQLRAVISAPTMRPDGTILDKPGFDIATGILFVSGSTWPKIPSHPTMKMARASVTALKDLLRDFPFVSEADKAAALSMMLTALVRPCLPTAPIFIVSAPTPGTGKSKLVDIASILATGQAASVMSAPSEEAEMQKQIGSALMARDAFITIDNIERPLRSEFLCQVLTQGQVMVRVLGESRTVKIPTSSTFCATGNSLRVAGDLDRRIVPIYLDAKMERPEDRVFTADVIAVAKARRVELVTDALTIVRAFIANNGRKKVPAFGSFEDWSDLVRSSLIWVGELDPLTNLEKVRESNPERERTLAILIALSTEKKSWTTADIARKLQLNRERSVQFKEHEALADALAEFNDRNGQFNPNRFSGFLRTQVDRIIDGRRIVKCGRDPRNSTLWIVDELTTDDF